MPPIQLINRQLREDYKALIEDALRFWSANLRSMLASKFGESKVGHMVITFPFGFATSPSWISDAKRSDLPALLRQLADHIESPDAKIVQPH